MAGGSHCGAALVGASPELLVARDGDRVTCQPFAGSAPRAVDPELDAATGAGWLLSSIMRRIVARWSVKTPCRASSSCSVFLRAWPFARPASVRGSRCPAIKASIIAHPMTPLVAEVIRTIAELGERCILLRALREGMDTAIPTRRTVAEALIEAARRKAAAAVRAEAQQLTRMTGPRKSKSFTTWRHYVRGETFCVRTPRGTRGDERSCHHIVNDLARARDQCVWPTLGVLRTVIRRCQDARSVGVTHNPCRSEVALMSLFLSPHLLVDTPRAGGYRLLSKSSRQSSHRAPSTLAIEKRSALPVV